MIRKDIGACLMSKNDLQELYDKSTHGIAFKIANPNSHNSVELIAYDATYDEGGLQLAEEPFACNINGCSIDLETKSQEPVDFIFEHAGELAKFADDEPFIAYFTKGQVDMILKLDKFTDVAINTYQPIFIDKITSDTKQIPNVSLMMQPYGLEADEVARNRKGIGLSTVSFGVACPKRWLLE